MAKNKLRVQKPLHWLSHYWQHNALHKVIAVTIVSLLVLIAGMYGIARWYIHSQQNKPLEYGVSFIPYYAESLGLNAQDTMDGLIDINVRHFRLVSYWNAGEPEPGKYDFSQLDWQFKKAEDSNSKVMLALGLRQPRWPECHMPAWAATLPPEQWQPQLNDYIKAVVDRYKDSPALDKYQLENEYFLKGFGECTDFSRDRLVREYNVVKQADPNHTVVVGRSNNALGIPLGQPQPDEFSISVYKRVWDAGVSHRYLEYPWPAWFYGFLAGLQQIVNHKNMLIGELQMEAWPPNGKQIPLISLDEQNKSINAKRFEERFEYGKATGMREIYMWGGEYWYYRQVKLNDPSFMNIAQKEFSDSNR